MSRCRNSLSSLSSRKKGYRFLRGPIDRSDRYRSWGGPIATQCLAYFQTRENSPLQKLYARVLIFPWCFLSYSYVIRQVSILLQSHYIVISCYLHFYPTFPWINLCSSSTWTFSSPSYKFDIHNKTSFTKSQTNWKLPCFNYQSLIGGFNHLEKYESQWEGLSHILWKTKHVWNHSIMLQLSIFIFHGKSLVNGSFNGKIIYKWAMFHGYVK